MYNAATCSSRSNDFRLADWLPLCDFVNEFRKGSWSAVLVETNGIVLCLTQIETDDEMYTVAGES